jgi:hypothetical protein
MYRAAYPARSFLWGMKFHFTARLQATVLLLLLGTTVPAQCDRWQQRVQYNMVVDLDVRSHRFTGGSLVIYTNNSPDTLRELWFHMYFNAFRPGSEMDVRSRTISDPDDRVGARIAGLKPEEMGELAFTEMSQQGRKLTVEPMGTISRVVLAEPVLPGKKVVLKYGFAGQVPVQIRRSGRDNAEGVAYSMAQWYPKLAHYDHRGWHAYPYVGREFHGTWGDFDVTLRLDSSYVVAATGELQNPHEIGHGYDSGRRPVKRPAGGTLSWRFLAKDVHDFAWAADPDYVHFTEQVPDGPLLHFFHKRNAELEPLWKQMPPYIVRAFQYMNTHFGIYPWPQYTIVQGGDGGMEYPMLTLITGRRRLGSLVGVSVHELVHSWYYGVLASNEGRFPWMDEGFTEYASSKVMQELFPQPADPHASAFANYLALQQSPDHEPPAVHADHFLSNKAYGITAYSFGELFVQQLGSVVGEKNLAEGLQRYYKVCGFKHPEPIDFERVMEKQSGLELDWYFDQWINTTRKLDYGIHSVLEIDGTLHITLQRHGEMLAPVDVAVQRRDGTTTTYHVPLSLMRAAKPQGSEPFAFTALEPWQWTNPTYTFTIPGSMAQLAAITLDPQDRTADADRSNDRLLLPEGAKGFSRP